MLRLSVLDLIPLRTGQTTGQAIEACLSLANTADRNGYHRFWVAEHHNAPMIASTHPAVLISMIAAHTENIRVGSGGVMLPNHTPLSVAEQFALLEARYPGRIDLGIGRAPGTDPVTSWALRGGQSDRTLQEFPSWVQQIMELLGPGLTVEIQGRQFELQATPAPTSAPEIWLLGSSDYSARLAAEIGLGYVFAHHFAGKGTQQALDIYRSGVAPAQRREFISANVVIANSTEEARVWALPYAQTMAKLRSGLPLSAAPTVEEAMRQADQFPAELLQSVTAPWLIGTPSEVAAQVQQLANQFGVEEIMVYPVAGPQDTDPMTRVPAREFALSALAEELGISPYTDGPSAVHARL